RPRNDPDREEPTAADPTRAAAGADPVASTAPVRNPGGYRIRRPLPRLTRLELGHRRHPRRQRRPRPGHVRATDRTKPAPQQRGSGRGTPRAAKPEPRTVLTRREPEIASLSRAAPATGRWPPGCSCPSALPSPTSPTSPSWASPPGPRSAAG